MNTCPSCRWSRSHGILSDSRKDWRCYQPDVNRLRPSFLAGNPQAAVRCVAERANVVGQCGTKGRKWELRVIAAPASMLEETWDKNDDEAPQQVAADAAVGESVRLDHPDGGRPQSPDERGGRDREGAPGEGQAGA